MEWRLVVEARQRAEGFYAEGKRILVSKHLLTYLRLFVPTYLVDGIAGSKTWSALYAGFALHNEEQV